MARVRKCQGWVVCEVLGWEQISPRATLQWCQCATLGRSLRASAAPGCASLRDWPLPAQPWPGACGCLCWRGRPRASCPSHASPARVSSCYHSPFLHVCQAKVRYCYGWRWEQNLPNHHMPLLRSLLEHGGDASHSCAGLIKLQGRSRTFRVSAGTLDAPAAAAAATALSGAPRSS